MKVGDFLFNDKITNIMYEYKHLKCGHLYMYIPVYNDIEFIEFHSHEPYKLKKYDIIMCLEMIELQPYGWKKGIYSICYRFLHKKKIITVIAMSNSFIENNLDNLFPAL